MRRIAWLVVAAISFAGCLFRNTSPPPRFFAPGPVAGEHEARDGTAEASRAGAPIQLRGVYGTAFLRERIVWRRSPVEYGQYENRLWCELPATYVQRALAGALRRTPGLRLTEDVRVPALRVEVLAFDEVLAPAHTATVSLATTLDGSNGEPLLDRTFTADASIAGSDPAMMAQAMGRALDDATTAVAAAVATAMRAR